MICFRKSLVAQHAANRKNGYEADVLASSEARGDLLCMSRENYARIRLQYAPSFGLGDAVASVAQPIAGALDAVLGTNIKGCGGCARRREALNKLVPNL